MTTLERDVTETTGKEQRMTEQAPESQGRSLAIQRMKPRDWDMLKEQSVALEQAGKGTAILPKGITNRYQISALLQKGWELGFAPMYSLEHIALINGRPSVDGQALSALIKRVHGSKAIKPLERTNDKARVLFRRDGEELEVEWTIEDAKKAELVSKDSWKKYPRNMLYWRCVAEGARLMFEDTIAGLYSPEELGVPVTVDPDGNLVIDHEANGFEAETSDWEEEVEPRDPVHLAGNGTIVDVETGEALASLDASQMDREEPEPDPGEPVDESPTEAQQPLPAGFKPPTENQRITIEKMQRLLGEPGQMPEGLSLSEASQLIAELNTRYHERRHQASVQK